MTTDMQSGQPTPERSTEAGSSGRVRGLLAKVASPLKLVLVASALAAAFWLGGTCRSSVPAARMTETQVAPEDGAIEYWTCSMHPQIHQPQQGRCPVCGMELVPVRGPEPTAPAKKARYACAMMCVPPMERPGKCPVCGMDMVPVEEYGDDEPVGTSGSENVLSEIRLSETARRLAQLRVAEVERRFVTAEVRMVGKVEYDETRQRTISSRVPGRLDRLFVDFVGVPVKQGDHLVHLYSPELLSAQQELIESVKAFQQSQPGTSEDLRRVREEALNAARQKLLLWGLTVEQVQEIEQRGTPSDHLTIYAPIGGIVTEKRLVEGAYVEEGTEIYTIADLSHVWVKLDAYELDLAWLRYGQDVEFVTEAYPGERFYGTIAFIDPVLNERTRTSKVRVNVPNPDGRLKPAMFVRAAVQAQITADGKVLDPALAGKWICPMHPEVVADGPEPCTQCGMRLVPAESLGYASHSPTERLPPLVIPATAPLITGKRAVVYVAQPDRPGRYEGREVLLGPRTGDFYLVREGLAEAERVVSQGNIYLDSAVQILAKRSMMQPETAAPPPGHAHGVHEPPKISADTVGPPKSDQPGQLGAVPRSGLSNEAQMALNSLFDAYFALHRALSSDQLDATVAAAAVFIQAIKTFNELTLPDEARVEWTALHPTLQKSAQSMAAAKSIEVARAAFEGASNGLIIVAMQLGAGARKRVLVYHCPMALDNRGARWLQENEGVENPYFGSAMFRCGVLKETIEGGASNGHGGLGHE